MNMNTIIRGQAVLLTLLLATAFPSVTRAADAPVRLDIQVRAGLPGGVVRDGTRLATGQVSHADSHTGFRVWSQAPSVPGTPGAYVLSGTGQPGNSLRVRLQGSEWQAAPDGRGLVRQTDRESVSLDVVADGDQQVKADSWSLQLQASALLPDAADK